MAQVAIVGTEGVGKTVLMTMMAWAFKRDRDGVRMIPMSRQTSEHVARVWTVLNGGDWPPSTPQGQLLALHWELHVDGAPVCDLRCLEIAGQDFRRLFADEEVNKLAELPEQLQRLAGFIQEADVIVFLANLRDFAGEADAQRADENQWALKFAMDWVRRQARPRRCCLVFTQSDQFGELKRQCGGWDKLAEKYLPYVYAAHVSSGVVPVMAVSAVGGTKVAVRDGRPLRVPDGKWLCKGLDKLAKWIGVSAKEAKSFQLDIAPVPIGNTESSPQVLSRTVPPNDWLRTIVAPRAPMLAMAVLSAVCLLLIGLVFALSRGPRIERSSLEIDKTTPGIYWPNTDRLTAYGRLVRGPKNGTVKIRFSVWWPGQAFDSGPTSVNTDDYGIGQFRIHVKVKNLPGGSNWRQYVKRDVRIED